MTRPLAITLLCAALLAGCGHANMRSDFESAAVQGRMEMRRQEAAGPGGAKPALTAPDEPTPHLAVVDPRQVVYTAALAVVVPDVPRAVAAAQALATRMGGYIQRRTVRSIILRVPAGRFAQALAELDKAGTVTDRDIRALDVTEQYVDLATRLRNYQALMARLEAMLAKANSSKEILEVEDHLRRARTEIERLQGQLNLLNSRISYSTITANFTRVPEGPARLRPALPFWSLSRLGLNDLMEFHHVR